MQGTAREYHAIVGLVRKFYALCRTRKDYAVLTHNSSATQSSKTDIANLARASVAVTAFDGVLVERDAAPVRRRTAKHQRGARRRIDFLVVMHLQDFDVERIVERLRHAFRERREQIDTEAHVARFDDHRAFGRVLDFCLVSGAQSGRSDDVTLPALATSLANSSVALGAVKS